MDNFNKWKNKTTVIHMSKCFSRSKGKKKYLVGVADNVYAYFSLLF